MLEFLTALYIHATPEPLINPVMGSHLLQHVKNPPVSDGLPDTVVQLMFGFVHFLEHYIVPIYGRSAMMTLDP